MGKLGKRIGLPYRAEAGDGAPAPGDQYLLTLLDPLQVLAEAVMQLSHADFSAVGGM